MPNAVLSPDESVDPTPRSRPQRRSFTGRLVLLRPIDPARDAAPLYASSHPPAADETLWAYMSVGPFADADTMRHWLEGCAGSKDPFYYTVVDRRCGTPRGMAAFMRIKPEHAVIEVGSIWYAPEIQRTALPTEAMYLMFRHAFDELRYRRLEWKCNTLNAASRQAALRLGFGFEGIFRQHMIIKGRNRDTAWFALLDREWPAVRAAMEAWLAPDNVDGDGRQRRRLQDIMAPGRAATP